MKLLMAILLLFTGTYTFAQTSVALREQSFPRSGFGLYYRTAGNGNPVLILSGGPGDDCDYMEPVALEIAKSAQAILLEQRGTGRSIPPVIDKTTINLAVYLDDIEALRTQLKLERWTLVGHSAGGLLAMYYAAAHPDRIDKLVLLDSAPIASEFIGPLQDNILDRLSPAERQRLTELQKLTTPDALGEAAQIQANALFFDRQVGTETARRIGQSWHPEIGQLLGNEISPSSGYDLRPRLKDFDRPVLVLNGRQDPMDPLMAYQTSAAFMHSTLRFIRRAGHFPWVEQDKSFYEVLDSFLK
jgi:proline iminopeptidase